LAKPQPLFDAARIVSPAVMVQDALHPAAPDLAHRTAGQQERVLDGDVLLVVIAVGDPESNRLAGEATLVHQAVKGVLIMIMLPANAAQLLGELVRLPGLHPPTSVEAPRTTAGKLQSYKLAPQGAR